VREARFVLTGGQNSRRGENARDEETNSCVDISDSGAGTGGARPVANRRGSARVRERYTKYEYRVPMRTGETIHAIYVPKERTRSPFLLTRTLYSIAASTGSRIIRSQLARPRSLRRRVSSLSTRMHADASRSEGAIPQKLRSITSSRMVHGISMRAPIRGIPLSGC
jgi:predicted acyl esterase